MFKQILVGVVATTALLINPIVGCVSSEDDPEFTFGETEMRAAVKGTYVGQLPSTGETVTLELDEATEAPRGTSATQSVKRIQCGSRTFIRTAAACAAATEMPLQGSVASNGTTIASGELQSGSFRVMSRLLDGGDSTLKLPDGATLTASHSAEEGMVNWQLVTTDGQSLTLELRKSE
ncbi:MAG: hypothetical protein QM784_25370 [Polyangiaceae bacterium]